MPASWTTYRGLNVPDSTTGDAGTNLKGDLQSLADRDVLLAPVRVVALSNVTSLSGAQTVGGVSLVAGDRVLLAAQTTATQNGPWVVQSGAWTRPGDASTGFGLAGKVVYAREAGTAGKYVAWSAWVCTNAAGSDVVGTYNLTFAPISVTLPVGSASDPTLTFLNSSSTGLYSPAANTVGLSTGGTVALTAANGRVGIGPNATAPNAVLSIGTNGIFNADLPVQIDAPSSGQAWYAVNKGGNYGLLLGYLNTAYPQAVIRQAHASDPLVFMTGGSTEQMRITNDGKVGIGTSAPGAILHVAKDPSTRLRVEGLGGSGSNNPGYELYNKGGFKGGMFYEESTKHITLYAHKESNNSDFQAGYIADDGGLVWGTPTGGSQGAGKINCVNIYVNGGAVPDYVFDLAFDGRVHESNDLEERLTSGNAEGRELVWRGSGQPASEEELADYRRRIGRPVLSVSDLDQFVRKHRHLPTLTGRNERYTSGSSVSVSELIREQHETIEHLSLYILELHRRLSALEQGATAAAPSN